MIMGKVIPVAIQFRTRVFAALIGLVVVSYLLRHEGLGSVLETLWHAALYFPSVVLLEGGILACSTLSLWHLYREDRHRIPTATLVRAGVIGYSVMGLVPAGRTMAESTRAVMLSRHVGAPRAAAAAAQMQGVALVANAAICVPVLLAMLHVAGFSVPTGLLAGNLLVTGTLGIGIFLVARHARVGVWLGRWIPRVREFGEKLDTHLSSGELFPWPALGWEFCGRLLQVLQNGILVVAVGGRAGVLPALCSEALHLVGAAAGDLIPGQLGATELNYGLSAGVLGLQPVDALSIALLAHLALLFWVVVGLVVSLVSRPAGGDPGKAAMTEVRREGVLEW